MISVISVVDVPPLWSPGKPLDIFHPVEMDVTTNEAAGFCEADRTGEAASSG